MKKAEIIKNGNVNLEKINWSAVLLDYHNWILNMRKAGRHPDPIDCFDTVKKIITKGK